MRFPRELLKDLGPCTICGDENYRFYAEKCLGELVYGNFIGIIEDNSVITAECLSCGAETILEEE